MDIPTRYGPGMRYHIVIWGYLGALQLWVCLSAQLKPGLHNVQGLHLSAPRAPRHLADGCRLQWDQWAAKELQWIPPPQPLHQQGLHGSCLKINLDSCRATCTTFPKNGKTRHPEFDATIPFACGLLCWSTCLTVGMLSLRQQKQYKKIACQLARKAPHALGLKHYCSMLGSTVNLNQEIVPNYQRVKRIL